MSTSLRGTARTRLVVGCATLAMVAELLSAGAAQGSAALSPVRSLIATTTGDTATVSWQPPVSGTVGRYAVEAHLSDYYNESAPDFGTRIVGPSTTSITWDGLPLNHSVYFTVTPIAPDLVYGISGTAGPFNATATVTPSNAYCPTTQAGDCVVVNTANGLGAEQRPGAGLLNGAVPVGNKWVGALNLHSWRIGAADSTRYSEVAAVVPPQNVIEVLSAAWYTNTYSRGYVADPWANWTAYTTFVATTVQQAEQAGQNPIWEIQNEPENYPYSPSQPPTRALVDTQYLKAYQAIKSVDPNARVIGPSIDWQYENYSAPWYVDMKTFIPFAATNGMKLYAIAWHDNADQTDQSPLIYQEMPLVLRDHAEEVRELIAENPGIGSPKLFVDENGSGSGHFIPAFTAGYLAAEDQAGVDEANRSCWPYPGSFDLTVCSQPHLGGLLNNDGNPNAIYWTMVDYAAMSGTRVESETSDLNLSSLAVTDASGETRVLLGLHKTCSKWTTTAKYCLGPSTAPAPITTTVQVMVPTSATSATLQIQAIPDSFNDLLTAPATTTSTIPVSSGIATVSIPSFGDGQAYFLTIDPNVMSGAAPPDGDTTVTETPPATGPSIATRVLPLSGAGQSAKAFHAFGQPLVALATDQYGNPLVNIPVTFTLPAVRYSLFADGSTRAVVMTDSNGEATSPSIKATLSAGTWVATATVTTGSSPPIAYYAMVNTR